MKILNSLVSVTSVGFLLTTVLGTAAFAADIQIGESTSFGTGCPEGKVAVNIDSSRKRVSLKFDPIKVEAGRANAETSGQKECNIVIPLIIPRNTSFAVSPVEYQGTVVLPTGSQAELKVVYYYDYSHGSSWSSFTSKFVGDMDRLYTVSAPRNPDAAPFWSACGVSANLRININLTAKTDTVQLPVEFTLDQIQDFEIKSKFCN